MSFLRGYRRVLGLFHCKYPLCGMNYSSQFCITILNNGTRDDDRTFAVEKSQTWIPKVWAIIKSANLRNQKTLPSNKDNFSVEISEEEEEVETTPRSITTTTTSTSKKTTTAQKTTTITTEKTTKGTTTPKKPPVIDTGDYGKKSSEVRS